MHFKRDNKVYPVLYSDGYTILVIFYTFISCFTHHFPVKSLLSVFPKIKSFYLFLFISIRTEYVKGFGWEIIS